MKFHHFRPLALEKSFWLPLENILPTSMSEGTLCHNSTTSAVLLSKLKKQVVLASPTSRNIEY